MTTKPNSGTVSVSRELLDLITVEACDIDAQVRRQNAIDSLRALLAHPDDQQGEPVQLQHMAVAEEGKLRWMTGRKMQDCELYAMPDGSGIRSKLYRL